jgi:hypothetical protein
MDWKTTHWIFAQSARALWEPDHPVSKTGAVIAKLPNGDMVAVVRKCDMEAGELIVREHNQLLQ